MASEPQTLFPRARPAPPLSEREQELLSQGNSYCCMQHEIAVYGERAASRIVAPIWRHEWLAHGSGFSRDCRLWFATAFEAEIVAAELSCETEACLETYAEAELAESMLSVAKSAGGGSK